MMTGEPIALYEVNKLQPFTGLSGGLNDKVIAGCEFKPLTRHFFNHQ